MYRTPNNMLHENAIGILVEGQYGYNIYAQLFDNHLEQVVCFGTPSLFSGSL